VLLFVIRDKSKTPLEALTRILEEDLGRMWAGITKPPQYADTQIDHFFEVRVWGQGRVGGAAGGCGLLCCASAGLQ
jgi:hypothetical protein